MDEAQLTDLLEQISDEQTDAVDNANHFRRQGNDKKAAYYAGKDIGLARAKHILRVAASEDDE